MWSATFLSIPSHAAMVSLGGSLKAQTLSVPWKDGVKEENIQDLDDVGTGIFL